MFRSRCHRPQHKPDSVEYHISSSQISFLLSPSTNSTSTKYSPRSRPVLITFPLVVTLKEILSQKDFIDLASKHLSTPVSPTDNDDLQQQQNTAYFELEGKILDDNLRFSSIILMKALILVINENIQLKFHESKRISPDPVALAEHRKSLISRLPIHNGHRPETSKQQNYPNESLDLLFDTLHGELSYITEYLKSHIGERHDFTTYPIQLQKQDKTKQWNEWETGIYKMCGDTDGTVNIALASDWGAGTMESALVASSMMNGLDLSTQQQLATPNLPHYSIHLGDIYYVGLPTEVQHCCLGVKPHWAEQGVRWPIGRNGSFTIPGNHELYSRGFGYWDHFLPQLGLFNPEDLTQPTQPQKTSYWLLENEQWRIIGLDTGYNSFALITIDNFSIKLPEEIMDWLKTVVGLSPQMTDKRGLLFFSHHQVVSAWDEKPYTEFPEQIASLLPEGQTVLYLWGHEHRLSFYEKQTIEPMLNSGSKLSLYGRCIGNSGFPTLATQLPIKARETKLLFYDDRLYNVEDKDAWSDMALGFNGYVTMKFVRPKQAGDTSLYLTYKSLDLNTEGQLTAENATILVNEEWAVDSNGNVILVKLQPVNQEMTKSVHINTNSDESSSSNESHCCTAS
ncbi:unnamed protein product [Adineta steineri]|uniref:Calcineurin-like phosphoesterase domain-containing protein n=1 Tax=Adineta steineri TaxID=433720 RepID=A0A814WCZ5_9BILA|nr:unnamed protein product [Adineta steineri]CAF3594706.1 unnamed protein product [Adineta steineri]CAF3924064.1 unnamed protein product [Adineta steineri]